MRASFAFAFLAVVGVAAATLGADVSSAVSKAGFECLKKAGIDFVAIRGYRSINSPDPNVVQTAADAWAAGLGSVEVYMFPCSKCGNPAGQVKDAITYLHDHRVRFNKFWFDIEGPGEYWGGNQADNRAFFDAMKAETKALGVPTGVYTSASQWEPIMGNYNGGAEFDLWYAHYDNDPSFKDFRPFGGWTKPFRKQFSDAGNKCGASYDINYQ